MRVSLLPLLLCPALVAAAAPRPEDLYQQHCASCHDADGAMRVPSKSALSRMSSDAIHRALSSGVMAHQGAKITTEERELLARWLGAGTPAVEPAARNACTASPENKTNPNWTDWGAGLANWRFQSGSKLDAAKLKLKWAFGFPNATMVRSQPAVVGTRLFTGSQDGSVYALDTRTGCVYWTARVEAEVRSAITAAKAGGRDALFFGDSAGFVNALDLETGRELWRIRGDEHPATRITAAPVFWNNRLYVAVASSEEASAMQPGYVCCTFRGSVLALDAATGRTLWRAYTIAQEPKREVVTSRGTRMLGPSGAAIWSSPTIDPQRNALYVTTGDNYSDPVTTTSDAVIAFRLDNGRMLWHRQFTAGDAMNLSCWQPGKANCPDSDGPDFDFGAPAMLVTIGKNRRALILGQKSGMMWAVDPDRRGRLLWEFRAGAGGVAGGIQWGMASDGRHAYAAISDMNMHPPEKRVPGGPRYIIDPKTGGGTVAVDIATGKQVWRTPAPGCGERRPCSPAQIAAVTATPGAVFSGSVDGHIRAYSPVDGRILWEFDTVRQFETVNGVPAKGGSLDVGGPVVAGNMVFVNSGYDFLGGIGGNVLLAFEAEPLP